MKRLPCVFGGDVLYDLMMWSSLKFVDLLQDPTSGQAAYVSFG